VQPADIAITLRRRSPWEAMDLGLTMLQRWWRQVYAAHFLVAIPLMGIAITLGWYLGRAWVALLIIWWLKPVYDRVVLHVLSRAVFGELQGARAALASAKQWLATGLFMALTFGRFDLARSFNLPVRQLEGQAGRAARERRGVLARRARGYAIWLTIVCQHLEILVLMGSFGLLAEIFLPAKADEAKSLFEVFFGDSEDAGKLISFEDAFAYAAAVLVLEPFYVAAGFALYLNRRTLLEGWDIEVALRRIAHRHTVAIILFATVAISFLAPVPAYAQEKDPKNEIAEVLKAKEFGYHREVERWQPRDRQKERKSSSNWFGFGYALAKAGEVLLWIVAGGLIAYALWWAARLMPRGAALAPEPYRPPAALFGMELAPETLPPDVGAAAAALAREGKLREALSLLYRGALSELVHKRGVLLLTSHTEGDVLRLSGEPPYLRNLVNAWRSCAYARRMPAATEVERLAGEYKTAFA
jgi:hypothetical protein